MTLKTIKERREITPKMAVRIAVKGVVAGMSIDYEKTHASLEKEVPRHYVRIYNAPSGVLKGISDRHLHNLDRRAAA